MIFSLQKYNFNSDLEDCLIKMDKTKIQKL